MSHLLTGPLPLSLKYLNQKLKEKGFEIRKRQSYVIEPMGEGRPTKARTMGQHIS